MIKDLDKCLKVISSCTTLKHCEITESYINLLTEKYNNRFKFEDMWKLLSYKKDKILKGKSKGSPRESK